MTTPTLQRSTYVQADDRLRFANVVRSEFVKLMSLRSTGFLLAALLAFGIGVSLLFVLTLESAGVPSVASVAFTLDSITLGTLLFGQIIAGVLGVLAITSEYSSGTIQPTLIAAPRRGLVLAAKAVVVFPVMVVTALISVFGSWAITYPLYSGFGIETDLAAPGFAFALVGGAIYVGLCAVFGLGVGALLRSAVGGSLVVFCTTLLGPVLLSVLPTSELVRTVRLYLLSHAGDSMVRLGDPSLGFADATQQYLSPAAGWITAMAWAAVALTAGLIALRRRDA
ncbi:MULTISPECIES: ABC transporter permease subunit [unclassified Microbacterium]|uniref:ABC transporter permease subunit n=1 Tax=unclassified Microbacterium TaxID=2609290 RepID=UPI000EA9F202|nr:MULTISPECIES: ABC transporter permease subunit [unclassified Microbacterium]MBT2483503.1 ABC transporter permease subunit [Microbacterium sp. ISL-108]RKN66522.1 ABC transporter permease [Microbacterium sp. CGR2]